MFDGKCLTFLKASKDPLGNKVAYLGKNKNAARLAFEKKGKPTRAKLAKLVKDTAFWRVHNASTASIMAPAMKAMRMYDVVPM